MKTGIAGEKGDGKTVMSVAIANGKYRRVRDGRRQRQKEATGGDAEWKASEQSASLLRSHIPAAAKTDGKVWLDGLGMQCAGESCGQTSVAVAGERDR